MFMRGRMEQKSSAVVGVLARSNSVEWKVSAIVENDSKKFAEELQRVLNEGSLEGYSISTLLPRATDNGLVVIHQREAMQPLDGDASTEPVSGAN